MVFLALASQDVSDPLQFVLCPTWSPKSIPMCQAHDDFLALAMDHVRDSVCRHFALSCSHLLLRAAREPPVLMDHLPHLGN